MCAWHTGTYTYPILITRCPSRGCARSCDDLDDLLKKCPGYCSGRGRCDRNIGCVCFEGWTGADCSEPIRPPCTTIEVTNVIPSSGSISVTSTINIAGECLDSHPYLCVFTTSSGAQVSVAAQVVGTFGLQCTVPPQLPSVVYHSPNCTDVPMQVSLRGCDRS